MARRRITLQRIAKDATRRQTYKKRVQGLMKKASELSTLCNVKVCILAYGEGAAQPEVWPSVAEAEPILARFEALPEVEQCKQMMNQEGFLRKVNGKLQQQLWKSERETHELENKLLLNGTILRGHLGLKGLSVEDLVRLGFMVQRRLMDTSEHIEELHQKTLTMQPEMIPVMGSSSPLPISYAYGNMNMNNEMNQACQEEGWLKDLVKSSRELGAIVYSGFTCGNRANNINEGGILSNNAGVVFSETSPGPFSPFPPM